MLAYVADHQIIDPIDTTQSTTQAGLRQGQRINSRRSSRFLSVVMGRGAAFRCQLLSNFCISVNKNIQGDLQRR